MRYYDLVEEIATYDNTGGTFTPTGAVAGRLGFSSPSFFLQPNEPLYYYASNADKTEWEQGRGTWSSGVFTRNSVFFSSNASLAVNFSGPVTIALVQCSRTMFVVDASSGENPIARGTDAMAAGMQAAAYGANSMAIGPLATIGSSEFSLDNAMAIGIGAQAFAEGACAIGRNASGLINNAVAGVRNFHWSGNASSFGVETVNLGVDSVLPRQPGFTTMAFEAIVMGRSSSGGDKGYGAKVAGVVMRPDSGAPTVVGSISVTEIAKTAGVTASASFGIVGTAGDFAIQGIGADAQQWAWACSIHGVLF